MGTPSAQLDIHTTQTYGLAVNGTSTSNAYLGFANAGTYKWRIGNTYNAGANTLDIYNVGTSTTSITIDSTTNSVGIGVNSATYTKLDINGQSLFRGNPIVSSGNALKFNNYYNAGTGTDRAVTTGYSGQIYFDTASGYMSLQSSSASNTTDTNVTISEKFRLASTGNLLLGAYTDDTVNKLQVTGSGVFSNTLQINKAGGLAFRAYYGSGNNLPADINIDSVNGDASYTFNSTYNSGWKYFVNNFAARISNAGALKFQVAPNGTAGNTITWVDALTFNNTSGAATFINLAGTGSRAVLADANGLLSAPVSDISVKQNIQTIGYGLSEILKMNPVWFDYIDEYKNYGESRQNGNIAQEMETIIPEAVFTTPSTGKMGINYDQLHAVYIKAIQELKAEIDALKKN